MAKSFGNGFENVSHLVGILSDSISQNTLDWKSVLGNVRPSKNLIKNDSVESWRLPLVSAFAEILLGKGEQRRPCEVSEPLCGLLPSVTAAQECVFSLAVLLDCRGS